MWLCWANSMVFYRAVWPAKLGASGAETLSEKLLSWSGLASGNVVVFILPPSLVAVPVTRLPA